MSRKLFYYFIGLLVLLNIYAWEEVFNLAGDNYLKVYFLNVGQGDAAFIETPGHHQILIDGGPDSTVLSKLQEIMPIKDMSLDMVILTHPEKDHMQGLLEVLKRYDIDYVLWTGVIHQTPEYQEWVKLLAEAQQKGTEVIIAGDRQKIMAGNVVIDILYPLKNLSGEETGSTSNDSSIVSRLIFGDNSFLFTGDMSSHAEQELIERISDIDSDALKVAHHGSKYSTSDEFLQAVSPEIAVISAGKNSYGHPAPESLQRLENFSIMILRTDIDGDIEIISNGETLEIIK